MSSLHLKVKTKQNIIFIINIRDPEWIQNFVFCNLNVTRTAAVTVTIV